MEVYDINMNDSLEVIVKKTLHNSEADKKKTVTQPQDMFNARSFLNGSDRDRANLSDIKILDKDWIGNGFMSKTSDLPDYVKDNRFRSSASGKFTHTGLGGNIGINPRPQFTRYADVKATSHYSLKNDVKVATTGTANTNTGMGRYYSEAIDDNQQLVFMEFGLPKFNNILDFFLRAVDYQTSVLANTGRSTTMYNLGSLAGGVIMLAAFPIITIAVWTLKFAAKLVTSSSVYSYYYLDPKMWMYWSTVNTIVSQLAVELGLLIPEFIDEQDSKPGQVRAGERVKLNQEWIDELKTLLPNGLIGDKNYIDVFAIATRAQAIATEQKKNEFKLFEEGIAIDDYVDKQESFIGSMLSGANAKFTLSSHTIDKYLGIVMSDVMKEEGPVGDQQSVAKQKLSEEKKQAVLDELKDKANQHTTDEYGGIYETVSEYTQEKAGHFAKAFDSTVRQGGAYVAFYVDYTASTTESFSNTVGEIETSGMIKQATSKARNLKFDTAGGNIVPGMADVTGAIKDFTAGVLNQVTFGLGSVLETLLGGAYIELPKKWDDSSMTLPATTYTMELRSPYGNIISQIQNLYIPLSMVLAGVMPLAAGKSSYTSPFICSLYSKGVQNTKLGMITSVTIERGVTNLGRDSNRRPLGINVSFQVTDFSTLMTSPVNTSAFSSRFLFSTEDDTPFGNYLTVLGGRDLLTNKYAAYRMKLKLSKRSNVLQQSLSGYSLGMRSGNVVDSVLGPLVSVNSLIASKQSQ